ncbi:transposase, IS110 family [Klebsiella pneumoniae]|uniref:Transposase, IS110 family n=3 Tax=Klebsiella pneumoniae TaxID=573 RepID=A0A377YU75_KLEPO|nr:transposase [Klebsiella pneumoniae]STU54636.1 transposase, IS110 family [Klebsiella pneumoniae subsp. ozaenae]KHF62093.1 transposase-like protein [Klebsiella pneumoniae]MDP8008768.1 transposase [Klebsiella pneumoniae subsp. pneumoniae]MDP8022623.1 transposase [Klebsiella pneumoniae subsp. pneumoniae]MDQ1930063.1 transposase [Klebsiella pneumoniae subsp. pneumoniae]
MLVILRGHHFDTAEQVAAFLGVIPVEKYSGTSIRGKPKLSKIGPPEIRAKLYLASLCGLRFNPVMKAMYERLCQRGKAKMCAIGALMRKLVHWCYGVLKTQKPFDAEYLSSDARSACKAALCCFIWLSSKIAEARRKPVEGYQRKISLSALNSRVGL